MRNSRMSLLGACVFVFGGVLIAAEFQESVEKDMQLLEGSFTMVSSEKKGEKAPENIVKSATITNKNGVHSVKVGEDSFGGTHKIDPTKKPKEIDSTDTSGEFKVKTYLGIYKIEKDVWTVCFAPPGKERPKAFSTKSGTGEFIHVWKKK